MTGADREGGAAAEVEPVALASLSVYVMLGRNAPNLEAWPATDDPDEHADAILAGLHVEPEGLAWRQSGGDDHGDGLTSFDYVAELADLDALAALVDWAGGEPGDGTPNMGILTGPEEWGHIPGGMTWGLDGMDWNMGGVTRYAGVDVSVFPITVDAATATFGPNDEEGGTA